MCYLANGAAVGEFLNLSFAFCAWSLSDLSSANQVEEIVGLHQQLNRRVL
jgi:hypothetical protein